MNTSDESLALPTIAVLGAGSMGGAILDGLRAPGVRLAGPVHVAVRTAASAERYADAADVVAHAAEVDPGANRAAVRGAGVVVLGVKPWLIHEVLREIAGELSPGTVVVSVAAGVTIESMAALLPEGTPIVRAMPNTPATVGLGVTGIAGGEAAGEEAIDTVRRVFATVGDVLVVREDQIDAVTAIAGSGPAYLFLYVEEMIAAAERLGFTAEEARLLAQGTVVGAAELLRRSGADAAELRRRVTSPKGTTERAVEVLQQQGGWPELFDRALAANIRRSEELAAG
ncbi:MAG: pyrroline-5-carboxylate reductase [Leucobacter sp.]|nr:pyrroline-5-carboxylate reductase [Leucobacter sp.]